MNIYWAVLLQFLGDEHIKWFYIVAATPWFSSATPKFASAGCQRRDLVFAGGFSDTNKAWCLWRYFSLQRTSSLDVFWGYLFSLLGKEQPSFEGGARICLCKVLFLWDGAEESWAVNMSGPLTLLLLVWGTWLVVNTLVGGGRCSADEERSCML